MKALAFNFDTIIDATPSTGVVDVETAGVNGHGTKDVPVQEVVNNELKLLKEKIELLEKKNEQLVSYVNFLFQLISKLQVTLREMEPADEMPTPVDTAVQPKPFPSRKEPNPILTKRELAVFDLLAGGLCAKEIASKLGISQNTVISHKKNLKAKFNAKNSAELISTMLRNRKGG